MVTTSTSLAVILTDQFIKENPDNVILRRRSRVATSAGGWAQGPTVEQPEQTFRKIPVGRVSAGANITTPDGKVVVPNFHLVCPLDANIQKDDVFTMDGMEYRVSEVIRRELFGRTVAEVIENAK